MNSSLLQDVINRAEAWPAEDQQKLAAAARLIEAQRASGYELEPADWAIIDQRAEAGDIAADGEVEAFFAKYRVV